MLPQQRKLAWTERKKKPKCEMSGTNSGKVSSHAASRFHKTSGYRQHEGGKMAYCEGTSSALVSKGTPGGGRNVRKCSLTTSPFLPPINAVTVESSLSLVTKQPSGLYGDAVVREPMDGVAWRVEEPSKSVERESHEKEILLSGSSPGCPLSQSVNLPLCWEDKSFAVKELVDFMRPPAKKASTSDLYKSCLLVLSSRRDGERGPKAHHKAPETFRSSAERSRLGRTTRRGLATWRSNNGPNAGEKQSSGDSAFGTESCSEPAEADWELGLETGNLEMDRYTQQRIVTWILQVNAALFSPSTDSVQHPLTEQDTSIKIVYDGD